MSIHVAKGAIIAVVRRFDHEGLRQVQNWESQIKIGLLYSKVNVLRWESCDGVTDCE